MGQHCIQGNHLCTHIPDTQDHHTECFSKVAAFFHLKSETQQRGSLTQITTSASELSLLLTARHGDTRFMSSS